MDTKELVNWKQIELTWEKSEIKYYKQFWEKKGFKSWRQWRSSYIRALALPKLQWKVREYINAKSYLETTFPNQLTWWRKFSPPGQVWRFAGIKSHAELKNHGRIEDIKKSLGKEMTLIVLHDKTRRVLVDGHHRSVAIVQADNYVLESLKLKVYEAEITSAFMDQILRSRFKYLFRRVFDLLYLLGLTD